MNDRGTDDLSGSLIGHLQSVTATVPHQLVETESALLELFWSCRADLLKRSYLKTCDAY